MVLEEVDIHEFENKYEEIKTKLKSSPNLTQHCIIISGIDKPYVLKSAIDTYDVEYCKENNIEEVDFHNAGGVIVAFPGDVLIGHYIKVEKEETRWMDKFLHALIDFISSLTDKDVEYKDNDILVGGKKVVGIAKYNMSNDNELEYNAAMISFEGDVDTISKICQKPMDKVPLGLKLLGINKEDLKDKIVSLIQAIEISEVI